jgi:hypothetical protein
MRIIGGPPERLRNNGRGADRLLKPADIQSAFAREPFEKASRHPFGRITWR